MEFVAPAGCSSAEAFERAVESRTTRVRLTNARERVRLQVRLIRNSTTGRVRGELSISDDTGQTDTREVEGAGCSEVAEVLALTASLALDRWSDNASRSGDGSAGNTPEGGDNADRSANRSDTGATAATERNPNSKQAATSTPNQATHPNGQHHPDSSASTDNNAGPEPHDSTGPQFAIGVAAHAVLAELVVPELSRGGELGIRLYEEHSNASLGIAASYLSNDLFATHPLNVRWLSGTLSACPLSGKVAGSFSVEPCALATYGWLWVRHSAVESPHTASRPWWSLGAALRGRLQIASPAELELELGAMAPLARRRFTIDPDGRAWESALVAPMAKAGLLLRF